VDRCCSCSKKFVFISQVDQGYGSYGDEGKRDCDSSDKSSPCLQ
jgi:hypothetical protein